MAKGGRQGRCARVSTAVAKQFDPTPTTSLKAFVKNGSDHEFRELIFELNGLLNQIKRHQEKFAKYIGVNPAQFVFIMIIAEIPNITVRQIADRMNVSSPFVTAEIGKLVSMGVVCKRENNNDRRSSFLNLTSNGENLVRELTPILRKANDLHFRSLTRESAKAFKETVHAIVADGRRVLHELESPDMRDARAPSVKSGPAERIKTQ